MRKYITKHDWKRCPMPFASANKKTTTTREHRVSQFPIYRYHGRLREATGSEHPRQPPLATKHRF